MVLRLVGTLIFVLMLASIGSAFAQNYNVSGRVQFNSPSSPAFALPAFPAKNQITIVKDGATAQEISLSADSFKLAFFSHPQSKEHKIDIAALTKNSILFLSQQGDGSFKEELSAHQLGSDGKPFNGVDIASGDINGDGVSDLIVSGYESVITAGNSAIYVGGKFKVVDGATLTSIFGEGSDYMTHPVIVDFNQDSLNDILFLTGSTSPGVLLAINNGNGTFTSQHLAFNSPVGCAGGTSISSSLSVAEIDNIPGPEVVAHWSNCLAVTSNTAGKLGQVSQFFINQISTNIGYSGRSVVAHDLNRDGRAELLITTADLGNSGYLLVLWNDLGSGLTPFSALDVYSFPNQASNLQLVQWDEDGLPDLQITSTNAGTLEVLKTVFPGPNQPVQSTSAVSYSAGKSLFSFATPYLPQAIVGAKVNLGGLSTTVDSMGSYLFSNVPAASYPLGIVQPRFDFTSTLGSNVTLNKHVSNANFTGTLKPEAVDPGNGSTPSNDLIPILNSVEVTPDKLKMSGGYLVATMNFSGTNMIEKAMLGLKAKGSKTLWSNVALADQNSGSEVWYSKTKLPSAKSLYKKGAKLKGKSIKLASRLLVKLTSGGVLEISLGKNIKYSLKKKQLALIKKIKQKKGSKKDPSPAGFEATQKPPGSGSNENPGPQDPPPPSSSSHFCTASGLVSKCQNKYTPYEYCYSESAFGSGTAETLVGAKALAVASCTEWITTIIGSCGLALDTQCSVTSSCYVTSCS